MFDFLSHDFIRAALAVGTVTAVASAILGNFVVAARQSVASEVLAHTALAGVGLGILVGVQPIFGAFAVVAVTALLLWVLVRRNARAATAVAMLLLTGGLAVALLAAHAAKNATVSLDAFLFGSILTLARADVFVYSVVAAVIIAACVALWPSLITVVFDPLYARTRLRHATAVEIVFFLMIAAITAVGLRVIGGLLIGALLVIPVLAAQQYTTSFRANVYASIFYGVAGVWIGIIASFYWDVPTASGIVLALIALFATTALAVALHTHLGRRRVA